MTSADDIKALLDMIAGTLDFGSGFLDSGEVSLLRRVAEDFGMDPWDFTPNSQGRNFPHVHTAVDWWPEDCTMCECGRYGGLENCHH